MSFVRDGLAGRKRKKSDWRIEPAAPVPKHKRIKTYCDLDDETMDDNSLPCSLAADDVVLATVDATPGLDPAAIAGERNTGPPTNSVNPTKNKQSNEEDYVRIKECVINNFQKIPSTVVNHNLINHLQSIDVKKRKNYLENIFKLCYSRAQGCLHDCTKMMEQLLTKPYVQLDISSKNVKFGFIEHKSSPYKDAEEKIEICDKSQILYEIICNKYIELFGMEYYELDNEILNLSPSVLKTEINLNKIKKTIKDRKSLCRLIKVESLNPLFNLSIDHDNHGSARFGVTKSEIDNHKKSMAERTEMMQNCFEALKLKEQICKIILINDNKFSMEIINSMALYFSNNDFLLRSDVLWKSSESDLIRELIMQLLDFFNNTKNNMAFLTGCLVCVFRVIVEKSSIPSEKLRSNFNVFMNVIKKHIKQADHQLWKEWFLSSMFLDWCLVLVNIFMVKEVADLEKLQILGAKLYFKKVKHEQYVFANKTTRSVKSGIFEFSKCEDLSDIGLNVINLERKFKGEKGINVVNEPFVEKKVETKSATGHKPIKIIELVGEPQLVEESRPREEAVIVEKPSKLPKNTNQLSASKTDQVLQSTCITKETNSINEVKKYVRVGKEFSECYSFENSPMSVENLYKQISLPDITEVEQIIYSTEKKTTQCNMIMSQSSTQAITKQNESVAFFTIPNNPHKYHLTNSVSQPPFSSNRLPTVPAQSSSINTRQHPTIINTNELCNISTKSYSSNTLAPNTFCYQSKSQATSNNNVAQNCYFNSYYNTCNSSIYQSNNYVNNTTNATNNTESRFVPVPSKQFTRSNTSALHHYYDTSISIEYSRNYTQITPSKTINNAPTCQLFSNIISNSTMSSRATSTNSISMSSSNSLNHQSSKSVNHNSSTASTFQRPEQFTQPSPDLPNAQSPNMPLQSNTNTKTLTHQKCTNANCYTFLAINDTVDQYSIYCCLNGHYCSTVCQTFDHYYHKNECCRTQQSKNK